MYKVLAILYKSYHTNGMETLINEAITARHAINDEQTVLSLLWIDASNLTDQEKAEKALEALLKTC